MSRKPLLITVMIFALIGMLVTAFEVQIVEGSETIYIKADGSIEGTDKIQRNGDVYTFIANISVSIVVESNDVLIDGRGYILQGPGFGEGIELTGRSNVTIKNTEIREFDHGIGLVRSSNNIIVGNHLESHFFDGIELINSTRNIISGNNVTNNSIGVSLRGSSGNNITRNHITSNDVGIGLYVYWALDSTSNNISGNNVTANSVYGIRLSSSFDNIIFGNNIANSVYGISLDDSANNIMSGNNITNNLYGIHITKEEYGYRIIGGNSIYQNNFVNNTYQVYPPPSPLWMQWWFWAIVTIGIIALVAAVYFLKRRKPTTARPRLEERRIIR
jgi:parallel beta-helix repeat protein